MYKTSITTVDGQKIEAETATVAEALSKFKPEFIKGKIIIEVSNDLRSVTKIINIPMARRMFYNPMALDIYARNIERALV